MEGDVFTPIGINQDRLWLHYRLLIGFKALRVRPGEHAAKPCHVVEYAA
jgi:hypothetical protein